MIGLGADPEMVIVYIFTLADGDAPAVTGRVDNFDIGAVRDFEKLPVFAVDKADELRMRF
jgi:hypothetical protein